MRAVGTFSPLSLTRTAAIPPPLHPASCVPVMPNPGISYARRYLRRIIRQTWKARIGTTRRPIDRRMSARLRGHGIEEQVSRGFSLLSSSLHRSCSCPLPLQALLPSPLPTSLSSCHPHSPPPLERVAYTRSCPHLRRWA